MKISFKKIPGTGYRTSIDWLSLQTKIRRRRHPFVREHLLIGWMTPEMIHNVAFPRRRPSIHGDFIGGGGLVKRAGG